MPPMSLIHIPLVEDADVARFVEALFKDKAFAQAPTAEVARKSALYTQRAAQKTQVYAEAFASLVRQRVQWLKPSPSDGA